MTYINVAKPCECTTPNRWVISSISSIITEDGRAIEALEIRCGLHSVSWWFDGYHPAKHGEDNAS